MTEPLPPLVFTIFLQNVTHPLELLDEGSSLGDITALNIVGDSVIADVAGLLGTVYLNSDRDFSIDLGVGSIHGAYVPTTANFVALEDSSSDIINGDVTYDDVIAKMTFPTAGSYSIEGSVSATFDNTDLCTNGGTHCHALRIELYSDGDVLQSTSNTSYLAYAVCNVSVTSYSSIQTIINPSANYYILVKVGVTSVGGASPTPINTNIHFSAQELPNYV